MDEFCSKRTNAHVFLYFQLFLYNCSRKLCHVRDFHWCKIHIIFLFFEYQNNYICIFVLKVSFCFLWGRSYHSSYRYLWLSSFSSFHLPLTFRRRREFCSFGRGGAHKVSHRLESCASSPLPRATFGPLRPQLHTWSPPRRTLTFVLTCGAVRVRPSMRAWLA